MRLRHALPAGLLDAGFASLARLAVGIYTARALTVSDLGAYALFFSAFVFASVVPMQFVLVPAELATLSAARPERLALLRQSWRIGTPASVATAVLASVAAPLGAEAPTRVLWPLRWTMTACTALTPLQEHVRRVLHLAGISCRRRGLARPTRLCGPGACPTRRGAGARHLAAVRGADDRDGGIARGEAAVDPAATAGQQVAEV
jgi:hypothetical protein